MPLPPSKIAMPAGEAPPSCPICCGPMEASSREGFSCGVHACCFDCAARHTETQVRSGKLPRCFDRDCRAETDPLLALRLLSSREDQERFLTLSLWSNPRVQACPKCRCMLYADGAVPTATVATCSACKHCFCTDCRCPIHTGVDCTEALRQHEEQLQAATLEVQLRSPASPSRRSSVPPRPARAAEDDSDSDFEPPRIRGMMRSLSTRNFERAVHKCGFKVCPRCRAGVEKSDDGCDHLTCAQCGHEFCWSCLADRGPIYAHGNHHHRPGCQFHSPWKGKDSFLPKKCTKCALTGRACQRTGVKAPETPEPFFSTLLDAAGQLFMQGPFFSTCSPSPHVQ
mmetsp:Transcript_75024/g.217758  ORF Transcript_75024/g.217758 Transcript_75024/m.217758 type:complete len:341 (-) Transcript_75024:76-1098(-)